MVLALSVDAVLVAVAAAAAGLPLGTAMITMRGRARAATRPLLACRFGLRLLESAAP